MSEMTSVSFRFSFLCINNWGSGKVRTLFLCCVVSGDEVPGISSHFRPRLSAEINVSPYTPRGSSCKDSSGQLKLDAEDKAGDYEAPARYIIHGFLQRVRKLTVDRFQRCDSPHLTLDDLPSYSIKLYCHLKAPSSPSLFLQQS